MTLQHHQASQPYRGNTPPRTTATQAAPAGNLREALTLLGLITDGQQGWLEVCWIDGDPTPGMGGIFDHEWKYITDQPSIERVARRCLELGETYGNVYVSSGLYTKRGSKRDAPMLDSRVIFLDDAPANPPLPYTLTIQTSADKRHAYYQTAERLTTAERVDLSRRAAAGLKSDKSGADAQQIVRVPGTFNTKAGAHYRVHIASQTRTAYTADELRAAWPAVADKTTIPQELDQARLEYWRGNIALLLDESGRLPGRLRNPNGQARQVLEGKITPRNDEGKADTSTPRAWVVQGLVLHGYPNEEIAALAMCLCPAVHKNTSWLLKDICELIGTYRGKHTHIQIRPTVPGRGYQAKLPSPIPADTPRPRHRPAQLTTEVYLAWLEIQADGASGVMIKRAEAASELGVSEQLIGRLERKMRDAGLCHRRTHGTLSWIQFGPKADDPRVIKSPLAPAHDSASTNGEVSEVTEQPNTDSALERENPNDVLELREHIALIPAVCPALAPASASPAPPVVMSPSVPAAAVAVGAGVPFSRAQGQRAADGWIDCVAPPAPRRRRAPEPLHPMNRQGDPDLGRPNRVQPTAVSLHNQPETPPPPAAPAALPPSPPVQPAQDDPRLVGVDWQAARRAWDRCEIGEFCRVHRLDRDAVIDRFIQVLLAA